MPPKAAKRKPKTLAGGENDPWDGGDEQPRKKSRMATAHPVEYGEDEGCKISKYFHTWGDWQTKFNDKEKKEKREFATIFKHKLEASRGDMYVLFGKAEKDLNVVGNKHTELLRDAFPNSRSVSELSPKESVSKARLESPAFKAGQQILQISRNMIHDHEQANRMALARNGDSNTHFEKIRTKWNGDMAQLEEVLRYGFQYGEKIVACNANLSTSDEDRSYLLTPDRNEFRETGRTALDMHHKSSEKLLKGMPTWGEEAKAYIDKILEVIAVAHVEK